MLREHRHRIGLEDDPASPENGEEVETLTHLLAGCPARAELRRIFGNDEPEILLSSARAELRRIFGNDEPEMSEALEDPTGWWSS